MPDPFSIDKEKAISRVSEAILSVAPDYFEVSLPDGTSRHQERVLAYEIYHQLRLRFNEHWYVNGEFRKGLSLVPRVNRDNWVIPDIVIHQPHTIEKNLIAMEIKTDPNTTMSSLIEDIRKLEMYTNPRGGLDFSIGIMLLANSTFIDTYDRGSADERQELAALMKKGHRVAIWNIAKAVSHHLDGSGRLLAGSIKIFRCDDVELLSRNRGHE